MSDFRPVVIIPSRNHGLTLGGVLEGLAPLRLPVIVVDDASDAGSAGELDRLAALHPEMTLLRHEFNRGKGGAFLTGLEYAASEGYTHALQVDSDGQHDLSDAPALIESACRHPGVLWSARPEYDESVPKKRLIGRYVTHVWVWIETLSLEIVDSMCGYRVYPVADTLAVMKSRRVGLFMDFDTEIMVRLYWRGLPVRFIHSRVIYPEGGRSNFRMWEDNVRISKMHARLFIESPLWWPARIHRLFRREPGRGEGMTEAESKARSEGGEHWSTTPERRGMWGLKLLWLLYRIGGRPLFAFIGTPVALVFRLTGTRAREASDRFLKCVAERRRALGLEPCAVSGHAHFRAFATSMLDRLAAWAGDLKLARDVDFADEESRRLLCEPTPDGRGRLVLVSHLGVAEATRALAQHDRAVPVWALMFDRHAPRFKAMLEAVAPDASRHVIAVDRLGVETASMLQDALERGEWVAIAADRTPNDELTRGDRTVTADFLGHEALFPAGPFILASLLKCAVVTLFAVRDGSRIIIKCEPFADEVKLPRRGRETELSRLALLWAQRLEAEVLEHPAQWFNFYDFWHEEDRR